MLRREMFFICVSLICEEKCFLSARLLFLSVCQAYAESHGNIFNLQQNRLYDVKRLRVQKAQSPHC